ncbi:hypothetical protein [Fictibacillus sp. NRS-1165]|uniref:hypothetical protein n=1 Tax=Fictibacillus sp. NRS-1165 TaxID=3144463 RepID=UPI003D1B260E
MKNKYVVLGLVLVFFIGFVSFSTNEKTENVRTATDDHPEQTDAPEMDVTKAVKKNALLLDPNVYALVKKDEKTFWLKLTPDMDLEEMTDIVNHIAYFIFSREALKAGMNINQEEVKRELEALQTGENKKYHDRRLKDSNLTKEQYWSEIKEQIERNNLSQQYLKKEIGEPSKVGGAEYKQAVNQLIEKTYLKHQKDIQVNSMLLKNEG